MNKLYNNILKSILTGIYKSLNERLFDDDIFDDDTNDTEITNRLTDIMTPKFKELILNTLCAPGQYNKPKPDDEEGISLILLDPENEDKYYIDPWTNYKASNLGPRKRKKYKYNYFYKYILTVNDDGNIELSICKTGLSTYCVIGNELYSFIELCPYKIDALKFHKTGNDAEPYTDGFTKAMIIAPRTDYKERYAKISDKFILHFPEIITPGEKEEFVNDDNPTGSYVTSIYRTTCSSDEMYIKLAEKLINNGFNVVDEDYFIYNQDTIDTRKSELLSGKQDKLILDENDAELRYLMDEFGTDYYTKFEKVLDYLKNIPTVNKLSLYTINTFRTVKVTSETTFYNIRKLNNMLIDDFEEETANNEYSNKYDKMLVWKMYNNLNRIHGYKSWYDFNEILNGCISSSGFYIYPDLNNLSFKFNDMHGVYELYNIIATGIMQCNGLYEYAKEEALKVNEELTDPESILHFISANMVTEYNNGKLIQIRTVNMHYLTELLKTIIDKICKKYKIK